MSATAVQELKAGRELDALIAEKVMGLKPENWRSRCYVENHNFDDYNYDPSVDSDDDLRETGWCYTCNQSVSLSEKAPSRYSTEMGAAWDIVRKLCERGGLDFYLRHVIDWTAEFDSVRSGANGYSDGDTAPLAICLAALKAVSGSPTE